MEFDQLIKIDQTINPFKNRFSHERGHDEMKLKIWKYFEYMRNAHKQGPKWLLWFENILMLINSIWFSIDFQQLKCIL